MRKFNILQEITNLKDYVQFKEFIGINEIHKNKKTIKLLKQIEKMKNRINAYHGVNIYDHNDDDDDSRLLNHNLWFKNKWKEIHTFNINPIDISYNDELQQYLHDLKENMKNKI
jgi:hypothetical protein